MLLDKTSCEEVFEGCLARTTGGKQIGQPFGVSSKDQSRRTSDAEYLCNLVDQDKNIILEVVKNQDLFENDSKMDGLLGIIDTLRPTL